MTKALPRQLEFPLLVNVNVVDEPNQKKSVVHVALKPTNLVIGESSCLEASPEDLTIYQSIGESFIRQFR